MTPAQHKLLNYIKDYIAGNGYAPSFDEMARGIGVKSKSHIHNTLDRLEEQGFIRRIKETARAIEVVANPTIPFNPTRLTLRQIIAAAKQRGLHLCERHYHGPGEWTYHPIVLPENKA
jgi:repressor LexA